MFDQDILDKHNIILKEEETIVNPYFSQDSLLWVKNINLTDNLCPSSMKRYAYTKIGKTFGCQINRFMSVYKDRLFYFDCQSNSICLGSCCIENIYLRWFKLEKEERLLYLSNGKEFSCYYFQDDSFFLENEHILTKYAVQFDFNHKFQILEELGKGTFSTVFKARSKKTGQLYTAKMVALDTPFFIVERQLTVLRQLMGAQHVCQFQAVFQCKNKLVLLTQYLEGRDLMTLVKSTDDFSLRKVKIIVSGIGKGLKQCHRRNIIHRDLKPENVIVNMNTMEPTIIDFGMVLNLKKQCQYCKCGTLAFMAPEIFNCQKTHLSYGVKSDLFCLGVIAHLMLDGLNPLRGKAKGKEYDRTAKVEWDGPKLKEKWGQSGLDMVAGLMNENPNHRWDANKLSNCGFLSSQSKMGESFSTTEDNRWFSFSCGSY